MFVKV